MKAVTRTRNPRGQGERLRHDLLEATIDLIAESASIDDVSLRAVAKRAGVSPTAVYQHFADRDALVEAAVVVCWEDFRKSLEGAFEVDDPFERLRVGGAIYAAFALSYPRRYAVMISETDNLPGATEIGLAAFNDLVTMVADILDANDDDRDPTYVATLVHTWTHGIVSLMPCSSELPWPELDVLLTEVIERLGLVPKGT